MNILEMENICTIFWYILSMTHNIVNSLSSINKFVNPLLIIQHHKIRFYFWISMDPNINECIDFLHWISSLLSVLFSLSPFYFFVTLTTKIRIVFDSFRHYRLAVMV